MKLIVLNLYSRNSLAIIESLDPSIEIIGGAVSREKYIIVCPDKHFKHKRVERVFRHHDPSNNIEKFKDDIIEACRFHCADGIIASGTTITNSLSFCKKEIEKNTRTKVLVEDYEKLLKMADKWNMYQLAKNLGVTAPFTVLLDDSVEMSTNLEKITFPAVVKPRMSYAAKGVLFINDRCQLDSTLSSYDFDGTYIVQEKIEGALHDVTACGQDGRAVSLLSQQRVKSLYDFGGGGIINITTDFPELREEVRRILSKISWNGPIEFDFIRDAKGKFYMIECNPKIWGTTLLTISAGMNVVQQAVDIFMRKKQVEEIGDYEVGLLYRWIFPECVFNWITKPRTPGNILRRVRETFKGNEAKRTLHSIHWRLIAHQIGTIFDRATL